ncbi:hypothetical protein J1N35_000986 [Gossypium stocksii]|uniref:Uncharacterized protein n=1 Tax=Gossypium stocksii TaxID=47602 RepID=A0A9D3WJE5_9ROSI|nr:hypothetical protein J1N35_000986 [Gossypium stocksii]
MAGEGVSTQLQKEYFGPPPSGSLANVVTDKGKGVLGAPPRFAPKETVAPQFGNLMKELVNLKQQGTVEHYQDMFVGLLNQLHLPEPYVLSIFLSNLKANIGHYLDLFEPSTLVEAF